MVAQKPEKDEIQQSRCVAGIFEMLEVGIVGTAHGCHNSEKSDMSAIAVCCGHFEVMEIESVGTVHVCK